MHVTHVNIQQKELPIKQIIILKRFFIYENNWEKKKLFALKKKTKQKQ